MDSIAEFLKVEAFDRAFAVLGNVLTGQFCLLDTDKDLPLTESQAKWAALTGMSFVGILGFHSRDNSAKCQTDSGAGLDGVRLMAAAVPTFLARIAESLESSTGTNAVPQDATDWLERLYNLPDHRQEKN